MATTSYMSAEVHEVEHVEMRSGSSGHAWLDLVVKTEGGARVEFTMHLSDRLSVAGYDRVRNAVAAFNAAVGSMALLMVDEEE